MELFDSIVMPSSLTQIDSDLTPLSESQQKFLCFALGSQERGLLPLEQIAEVVSITIADILPVPEMPNCVLGIHNWRGKMLWLVDLNYLLDYPPLSPLEQSEALMAMVIQINGQSMGLVVQYVLDIELYDPIQIQPASADLFPPRLLPFLLGYLLSANALVFDSEAIARCPLWQVHQN